MKNLKATLTRILAALGVAVVAVALAVHPAAAQTAKKLKCNGCVTSKQIKNGAIKSKDIGNNSISNAQIQNDAITSGKIVDGQVATPDLAGNAVTSDKIADGQVGSADLAADAVTAGKIQDGAVGAAAIASESVPASDLSNEAGAGFNGGLVFLQLTSSPTIVRAVTITAPSAGAVIVNASGFFDFRDSGSDTGICSITTGTTLDDNALIVGDDSADSVNAMPFAGTRGFVVGPGSNTFRLVCEEIAGDVRVDHSQITALFVPTVY